MTARLLTETTLLCALVTVLMSAPALGANPKAGLPMPPQWLATADMVPKWGGLPVEELRAAAEKGEADAQHFLGWKLAAGESVPKDDTEAVKWFRKAAEAGLALAANNLGVHYELGRGVAKNPAEAVRWYRRAADQHLPAAQRNLGRVAAAGLVSDVKPEDSRRWYELAAELGDTEAMLALARSHRHPTATSGHGNIGTAIYWLTQAAELGRVEAFADIGWLYMDGLGTPHDCKAARRWFERGAEKGESSCQVGMAMYELHANEAGPDLSAVRGWLEKAAAQNNAVAFFQLGRLAELWQLNHPPELKPDLVAATKWYQRAAEAGNRSAVSRLAVLASQPGAGVDAIERLRLASDQSDLNARVELITRYLRGDAKPRHAQDEPAFLIPTVTSSGAGEAMIRAAEQFRLGNPWPKDPLLAMGLLDAVAARGVISAWEWLGEMRELARANQPFTGRMAGMQEAFALYVEALHRRPAEPAARIARSYLDGSRRRDDIEAYAWFALAAQKGDPAAAAERDRLFNGFDEPFKQFARRRASHLTTDLRGRWFTE